MAESLSLPKNIYIYNIYIYVIRMFVSMRVCLHTCRSSMFFWPHICRSRSGATVCNSVFFCLLLRDYLIGCIGWMYWMCGSCECVDQILPPHVDVYQSKADRSYCDWSVCLLSGRPKSSLCRHFAMSWLPSIYRSVWSSEESAFGWLVLVFDLTNQNAADSKTFKGRPSCFETINYQFTGRRC